MAQRVAIRSSEIPAAELKSVLDEAVERGAGVQLELISGPRFRDLPDPNVLVAVISAGTTAVAALIGGLSRLASRVTSRTVTIVGSDGRKLVIPADLKHEDLADYVEQFNRVGAERIEA